MKTCTNCGLPNEDEARFCARCGRATTDAPMPGAGILAPSSAAAPPAYVQPAPWAREPMFKRIPGYRHRRRTTASVFLLIAFVLIAVSLGTAWWGVTDSGADTASGTIAPGGGQSCTAGGTTTTACGDPTSLVGLYQGVGALVGTALGLAIVACVFGFLGAFGLNFGRWQLLLTYLFTGVVFLLLLAALAWSGASTGSSAGNGCAPAGSGLVGQCTFAGSASFGAGNGATTVSWGPSAGWFLAFPAIVFLAIGALLYFQTRREPYTARELGWTPWMGHPMASNVGAMWAPGTSPSAPAYPPGYPVSAGMPSAAPATPPGSTAPCPACGAINPPGARFCGRCARSLLP